MDEACVIKFPHPGAEHNPPRNVPRQSWNVGDHRRKFLLSPGSYVGSDGKQSEATLVFWGEWEPPSLVEERWPLDQGLPRFLHKPVWEYPTNNNQRQNTDPWVFGDCFRYSNCKQLKQRGLRKLSPESVIFFGSTISGNFVVDTVFVVATSQPFTPRNPPETDDAFRVCTIESLERPGLMAVSSPCMRVPLTKIRSRECILSLLVDDEMRAIIASPAQFCVYQVATR